MEQAHTIIPNVGVDEFRFGMTRAEVHGIAGAPDDIWNESGGGFLVDWYGPVSIHYNDNSQIVQIGIETDELTYCEGIALVGDMYEEVCNELLAVDGDLYMNDDGCVSFELCIALLLDTDPAPYRTFGVVVAFSKEFLDDIDGTAYIHPPLEKPNPRLELEGQTVFVMPFERFGEFEFGSSSGACMSLVENADWDRLELEDGIVSLRSGKCALLFDADDRLIGVSMEGSVPVICEGVLLTGQYLGNVVKFFARMDEFFEFCEYGSGLDEWGVFLSSRGACYPTAAVDRVTFYSDKEHWGHIKVWVRDVLPGEPRERRG